MGLSSNILWHQTTKDGLIKIIKTGRFKFSYSKESIFTKTKDQEELTLAIPMISFSDLPFSELEPYMGKYGHYIIGMNSKWGIRLGFSPVWYCYSNSKILVSILEKINKTDPKKDPWMEILKYIKFVEGPLVEHNYSKYRFMDEREVRLCPELKDLEDNNYDPLLTLNEYTEYKKKHQSSLLDLDVMFHIDDIKYIIVRNFGNIEEFDKLLKSKKNNHKVHIFSEDQIKEDFIGLNHDIKVHSEESLTKSSSPTPSTIELIINPTKLLQEIIKQMERDKG